MRRAWCLVYVVGLVLGGRGLLRSDEPPNPRAIVDRAIKAHGGAEKLNKYKAATMKGKGTFYGLGGNGLPYTGEWAVQGAHQIRFAMEATANGKSFKMTEVVDGKKGWIKIQDGEPMVMNKDQLQEEQEEMYAGWVATLAPLQDKKFKLAPVGEAKVEGKAALGIKVQRKGHGDVNLFFDKKSGLLVKSEFQVKDVQAGNKEAMQETLYQKYKAVNGMQEPTRIVIRRDGKLFVDAEMSDIHVHESLDPGTFARP
jgi:hypothetical protein